MAQTLGLIDLNSSEWLGTSRLKPSLLPHPLPRPFSGTKRLLSPGLRHGAPNLCWLFLSDRANRSGLLLFIVIFWSLNKVYTKPHFLTLFAACRGKTEREEKKWVYCLLNFDCLLLSDLFSSLPLLSPNLFLPSSLAFPQSLAGIIYTQWTQTLPTVKRYFSVRWVRRLPLWGCVVLCVIDSVTSLWLQQCVRMCMWVHLCACQQSYSPAHRLDLARSQWWPC